MHKYLVRVLVVLLHVCFKLALSVLYLSIGRHFFPGHPYIVSTTVLPDESQNISVTMMVSIISI